MSLRYEDLTDREKYNLKEFLLVTMVCTEEQLSAMDHQTTMTQALFEQCLDVCVSLNAVRQLDRLMQDYPEFLEVCARDIDQLLEDTSQ